MKKTILLAVTLTVVSSFHALAAINLNVLAGSSSGSPFYQTSSEGTLSNGSLILIGILDLSSYNSLSSAQQNDFTTVLGVFNQIAQTSIDANGEAFTIGISGTFTSEDDPLYTWVFNSASGNTATEWGIFHATSSTVAPWLMPPDLSTVSLNSSFIDTVVVGSNNGGNYQLAPIPEPTTFLLFGLAGLAGVVFRRRG